MKKLAALTAALALCIPLALTSTAPAGDIANAPGWDVKCGDAPVTGTMWFDLKGEHIRCRGAEKAADYYVFETYGSDLEFNRWVCTEEQIGDEVYRVDCRRPKGSDEQHIRFKYGS